jgi:hypothetical protein
MTDLHLISYYIGIFIVFSSHVYMLVQPGKPMMSVKTHSYINLIAVLMIAYYFTHKEGFIHF